MNDFDRDIDNLKIFHSKYNGLIDKLEGKQYVKIYT